MGTPADWLLTIATFLLFGLLHSILAGHRFKARLSRAVPGLMPWYRLLYNGVALATLALWLWIIPLPGNALYRVPAPYALILRAVQLAGVYALVHTAGLFGSGRFLGIRQIQDYLRHGRMPGFYDEDRRGTFVRKGSYRYMRHPLYTYSMLVLMAEPVMSPWLLGVIICSGLYFAIGSVYEERKLTERFGEVYHTYQREVPRFLPDPRHLFSRSRPAGISD